MGADGAPPMTLIYSPPGVVHRDRCRSLGDRFLIVEVESCLTTSGTGDPLWIKDSEALAAAGRIAGRLASCRTDNLAEDLDDAGLILLETIGRMDMCNEPIPGWASEAFDALRDMSPQSDLRMAQVAHQVGVHPVHLSRFFRKKFGCSPGVALRRFRVWRAAAALSKGVGLAQVALDCGFADQSHLTRSFSQILGTTPGRFQKAFS